MVDSVETNTLLTRVAELMRTYTAVRGCRSINTRCAGHSWALMACVEFYYAYVRPYYAYVLACAMGQW